VAGRPGPRRERAAVQSAERVEEAWIVIWPQHLGTTEFQQGVDRAQLAADYQALTGSQLVLA
jgi:hypothetical protein